MQRKQPKLYFRGTSRPEVFPFGEKSEEDTRRVGTEVAYCLDANYAKGTNTVKKGRRQIIQVNQPTHSNDRVYNPEGVSPTLNTMQGGNRQPFIVSPTNRRTKFKTSDISNTLTSHYRGSPDGDGRPGVLEDNSIRRLTPLECERLQGFPDGWTKFGEGVCDCHQYEKQVCDTCQHGVEISDSQRYKMCGNAVTVNVIKDIMEKLLVHN